MRIPDVRPAMSPTRSSSEHSPQIPIPASPLRYRLTLIQRVAPFLAGGIGALAVIQILLIRHGHAPVDAEAQKAALVTLGAPFLGVVASQHFRATATPEGLAVHATRSRLIPWRTIADIRVEGSRIVVYETTGRRTPLRAPARFLNSHFDEKHQQLLAWWTLHRDLQQ
ncbi:PH domain-containing protein [Kitasatospora sp. NPDC085879]|uniref:PH domain-containing protein n=1 Tax=Kitasatospora sp. NPDC085879 TaxID=3154769 RepID=UPI00344A3824